MFTLKKIRYPCCSILNLWISNPVKCFSIPARSLWEFTWRNNLIITFDCSSKGFLLLNKKSSNTFLPWWVQFDVLLFIEYILKLFYDTVFLHSTYWYEFLIFFGWHQSERSKNLLNFTHWSEFLSFQMICSVIWRCYHISLEYWKQNIAFSEKHSGCCQLVLLSKSQPVFFEFLEWLKVFWEKWRYPK